MPEIKGDRVSSFIRRMKQDFLKVRSSKLCDTYSPWLDLVLDL